MSNPSWLQSQVDDRARTADALGAAADQMNVCRSVAADLHAQGREHQSDPAWQAEVCKSHQLDADAEVLGIDIHDIGAEAARRRTP
ncbi:MULTISPECIES: hypothetical protein [unclassified Streptomyces]|uniref:hypothetical protein n=1 Tax=unclassified Streptomyces TaxID=2593676 RepID=UPI00278BD4AB|nr:MULTISPECIES: hypothetical protein [unclassified Streptomyces]